LEGTGLLGTVVKYRIQLGVKLGTVGRYMVQLGGTWYSWEVLGTLQLGGKEVLGTVGRY
jgi:hypothetical protein